VSRAHRGVSRRSQAVASAVLALVVLVLLAGVGRGGDWGARADAPGPRGALEPAPAPAPAPAPVPASATAKALARQQGRAKATSSRRADAPVAKHPPSPGASTGRAPESPPLIGAGGAATATGGEEADAGAQPQNEADPLVSNGLGSPLCMQRPAGTNLSPASRQNCETSGFIAAAAPTGNFGIDVHIDTGLLPFGSGELLTIVQDLCVTPLWMALVWAAHALVVMLEWCFTLDLLDSGSVRVGLANGLRQMQAAFTLPWLASVLAVGALLCAYNGLVRRRVAESLGQALIAVVMIAGGSWVMLDPAGTIGTLGAWANQASLGTLAVTARGTPLGADRALADSMGTVFAAVVEVPWCYLEFGDVGWCRNPARLDPRLRAAALELAGNELHDIGCNSSDTPLASCASTGSTAAKALQHSARLLRAARTNGAIFLALPPNGPARNAINDPQSLLRAICQSDDATSCRGPTAAQAEFRTSHGTWARVGGLLLIAAGALGMLLLLGFVALRLLTSAIFSLLYLMLAPAVVLAPALGEGGRAIFRKWAARLLGAVVSKLLFSFLLGAILAILGILANLEALGWWTQWLLMSAFWWGAFAQRHQVLALTTGEHSHQQFASRRVVLRHLNDALDARRKVLDGVHTAKERLAKRAPRLGEDGSPRPSGDAGVPTARSIGAVAAAQRAPGSKAAGARASTSAQADGRIDLLRHGDRLERLRVQHARALAAGNTRRAARLALRAGRIERGNAEQGKGAQSGGSDRRGSGRVGAAERLGAAEARDRASSTPPDRGQRLERFLDAQSALPPGEGDSAQAGDRATPSRNYVALAGIAGYGPREYERLGPREMRAARAQIDRELALRFEQASPLRRGSPTSERPVPGIEPATARARGREEARRIRPDRTRRPESEVMRDAREVAARRKRQLGRGTP
jgi:hypothetical protein